MAFDQLGFLSVKKPPGGAAYLLRVGDVGSSEIGNVVCWVRVLLGINSLVL